jgi:hypothetical protein
MPGLHLRLFFSRWAVPLALLALLVISFGLFIPLLGFYWDDWPVILTGRLQGAAGFLRFYEHDRPVSAWTYILTFPLLGSRPVVWHVFSLLLRWLTSAALWWVLIRIWPRQQREAAWAAFLFAVYPVFTQQSIAVAYSQHWICYLLYFSSLGAMVQAHRTERLRLPLTLLSVSTALLHLLTMEYFAGLELLRPLLLWVLASEQPGSRRQRIMVVVRRWLPYLAVLAGFTIWRLFFLEFPGEDANAPRLLQEFLRAPGDTVLRFFEMAAQDTIHVLLFSWSKILAPENIALRDRSILFSWGMGVLAAVGTALFFFRQRRNINPGAEIGTVWRRQAVIIGAAALLLGMIPVWLTDRQIIVGTYSNRFGLPAMFGASLMLAGLLSELIRRPSQRIVLVALLVGLAVSSHLRTANNYRWSWVRQTRFYHQLAWRAPGLQPGTAIFSDGEIFSYAPLTRASDSHLPYWFFSLGREFQYSIEEFRQGMPLERTFRHYTFSGSSKDGLVIFYNPDQHDCLNILIPEDANAPNLLEITRKALPNSNLSRIDPSPLRPGYPPEEIFGPEPERGWCYYYQKADLARQTKDWEQAAALGDAAQAAGFTPDESASFTPLEWLPMIEGYARTGRWDEAEKLSLEIYQNDRRIDARLCNLWDTLETTTPASEQREIVTVVIREAARCP